MLRRWLRGRRGAGAPDADAHRPRRPPSPGFARDRARRNARALGPAERRSVRPNPSRRSSAPRASTGSTRCSCRCAAAATRTSRAASNHAPPISSVSPHELRSAGDRPRPGARGRAARARVGQRQSRLERRRPAERARAPRPPPSRVADGAARSRAGAVARRPKRARRTSASWRAGRARSRRTGGRAARSKASTRRRSCPRPPITSTPSSAISSRATRSTASTSTTRATRPNGSTTAAAPFARSATRSGRSSPAPCAARSTAQEADDPLAYPDTFPDEWKAFRISRLTALVEPPAGRRSRRRGPTRSSPSRPRPTSREARDHRLQDWARVARRRDSSTRSARWPTRPSPRGSPSRSPPRATSRAARAVWAGIGAYRLSPAQTIENIETARRLGAAGVILFSYDSLIDPRQSSPDYLAVVGRVGLRETRRRLDRLTVTAADGP